MAQLDDWDLDGPPLGPTANHGSGDMAGEGVRAIDVPPKLRFGTVEQFVDGFLSEVMWLDTTTSNRIWYPQCWRHPAAIVRLEALHTAFE